MSRVEFLADSMLGKLARWLRLMGYYAEYATSDTADTDILNHCREMGLFLLSRDRELCSRYSDSIYIRSENYMGQLREVVSLFPPDSSRYFTRCPICNTTVEKIRTDSFVEALPEGVKERFEYIYKCKGCGKVYWEGSHFESILESIREIERTI